MELTLTKYKQTEAGLIPEDWEIKCISDLSSPVRGGSPRPAGSPLYFNGNFIPWLTVASLTNIPDSQLFVNETKSFLTEAGSLQSRKLDKGTLIIANSGATLGVAKLLGVTCCANDGVAALLNIKDNIDPKFLVYYINSITKKLRDDIATGNGQPNLNTKLIGSIKVPLPPTLIEQQAISKVLFDTDDLIQALEKKIVKKRGLKKGVTEQLLTPKDNWENKPLGYIVEFLKGNGLSKSQVSKYGKYQCLLYGELFTTYNEVIKKVVSRTDTFQGTLSKDGDILMPGSTTTSGIDLATASSLKLENILLGGDVNILRPKTEVNSDFLARYLTNCKKAEIANETQGITIIHLYGHMLKDLVVSFPSMEVQNHISQILSDMDKEINLLKEELSKYKLAKQGMMQQLLTGKIRLV
jgi:type I restriction enzyme S subunit